jgi:type VI protein secretion system component Hcp
MDNAQLYLSLVRPSMIPVVGEAADDLFRQQIEVTGWKWGFHNLKEQREAERKRKEYGERADFLEKSSKSRKMEEALKEFEADHSKAMAQLTNREAIRKLNPNDPADMKKWIAAQEDLNKAIKSAESTLSRGIADLYKDADLIEQEKRKSNDERAVAERRYQDAVDEKQLAIDLENQKFSFSFTKRIDLATTQMLNSMKAGDLFPLAIFTMHQYSANNPMSLVIKIEGLRLVKYGFNVDASDTMTDLKEEWTCDFKGFSYVYQNRRSFAKPSLGSVSDAKQIAAKAATQGTVRTFVMMPRNL